MPRPAYIICSESHSLDQTTNLLSVFHIIEGFDIVHAPLPPNAPLSEGIATTTISISVNAAWMRSDDDEQDEYESQITMKFPGEEDKILMTVDFKFIKLMQRFTVFIRKVHPWPRSGMCTIESRIRAKGSERWLSQEYRFPVTVRDQSRDD